MRRHWLCNLVGHDYDETARWYYNVDRCERCGAEEPDPASLQPWHLCWLGRWWWGLKVWLKDRWRDARIWWRCDRCDGRFGRHDEERCLPF